MPKKCLLLIALAAARASAPSRFIEAFNRHGIRVSGIGFRKDGKIVQKVDSVHLDPADFSPLK